MGGAAIGTETSPLVQPADAPDRPRADPLDDAAYEFPTVSADPYAFARFDGHLPALRLPTPRPGGLLTRATARRVLIAWSVVDLWAFVAALRLGPGPLAPIALAGLIATCWHLRSSSRRRALVSRATAAMGPALAPLGATASRHGHSQGHRLVRRPQRHGTFSPRVLRRRRPLVGTRRPSDWWPAMVSPSILVAGGSVMAGVVVHSVLSGAGPLH